MNQFVSEAVFGEIVSIALEYRFQNIQALSEEQKKALHGLINRKDVFAILPTGHGKSLIFQLLPDLCRQLSVRGYSYPTNPIIMVICPLKSLIESHIRELQSYGLTAAAVSGDEVNDDAILRGEYSFVFGSPESFLQNEKWRQMLLSKDYQSRLLTFVTDEAHVVPKWGFDKAQKAAFRKCFSRIGELRSLGPNGTPMLSLTATAKLETQTAVINALALRDDFELIYVSPYRANIYLTKLIVSTKIWKTFAWLIERLRDQKNALERTIIYCKSIKDCGQLFQLFKSELGDESYFPPGCEKESTNLLFGMFHHNTLAKQKERILNSLYEKDGVCRVVFATNALGMGVNFPNVRTVINYGPPREVEEFVQQIGRAGRDGQPALAVLLYNGHHLKKCEDAILSYCDNTKTCLRKQIASEFQQINELTFECGSHKCCVNCHSDCNCEEKCPIPIPSFVKTNGTARQDRKKRTVSKEDRKLLQDLLIEEMQAEQKGLCTYLNPECTAGFSKSLVKAVLEHCKYIFTLDDIVTYLPVLKKSHAVVILQMFAEIFEDVSFQEIDLVQQVEPDVPQERYDLTYGKTFDESQSSGTSAGEENSN
ncbi:uncharacterized protein LOC111333389 isoform X2 [Stylophora pistillata]|uniref:uncharacterized protein LOC111333389 isoform X1 n=1 Tax=Stylophora pistillata TaxID=50429 RepID=UPI000C04583C|nr:uncharacterized protein LOC111333389 isoform X1 [Stylophora pistillata]XP_022794674.1 uncharacterized protein LOC111333389 isoform X2 [Stylophora pistillata]